MRMQSIKNFVKKYKVYVVLTVIFLFIVILFGDGSISEMVEIRRRISSMKREQREYRERSKEDSIFLENLKHDWFLEKYAREHLYMIAPGEEIFLLDEKR